MASSGVVIPRAGRHRILVSASTSEGIRNEMLTRVKLPRHFQFPREAAAPDAGFLESPSHQVRIDLSADELEVSGQKSVHHYLRTSPACFGFHRAFF